MADRRGNLFAQLARLFKSGPIVKRKVKSIDTRVARADPTGMSSVLLLSKTQGVGFNAALNGQYGVQERQSRLQDYNEMDAYALVNAALDIYADESVAQDANGKTLHIHSDNPAIKENLEELFYNTLNAEFNIRPWTRNLCKYGDFYLYIDVSPAYGVINVIPIPVNELAREEGYDLADPLAVRFRWVALGNKVLENWEVAHFRLLGNDMFLPYGSSMVDGARRSWRQLVMIEDAMLVYRITRAVDRRVFYVDVGGVAPDEIGNYMEAAKSNLKSQGVVDRATGKVDQRYAPLSIEEDYWIATRGGETGTKIDTLPAGQNAAHVEDVEYIKKQLIAALKVPAAYLGYNDAIPGCFVGNTSIPSTDGKCYRIDDLASMFERGDKVPNVYSFNLKTGKKIAGRIVKVWETKKTNDLVKVTLRSSVDGNETCYECTPDHRFLLTDGSYKEARDLTAKDAIESQYGRYHDGRHCKGYLQHFDRTSQKWEYTHRRMAELKYGTVSSKEIVHHVDFDKLNNDPSNLIVVKDATIHQLLHATYNRVNKTYTGSSNPNFKKQFTFEGLVEAAASCSDLKQVCEKLGCSARIPHRLVKDQGMTWLDFVKAHMPSNKGALHHLGCDVHVGDIVKCVTNMRPRNVSVLSVAKQFGVSSQAIVRVIERETGLSWDEFKVKHILGLDPTRVHHDVVEHGSIMAAYRALYKDTCGTDTFKVYASDVCKSRGMIIRSGAKQKDQLVGNHTVVSVEAVRSNDSVPVYDLEIEHYHNFAVGDQLDAAFVHNSSGLAQVDIRFSRTVNMIQRTIVSELNKVAMIHLYAAGFRGEDLMDFEISLSNPSTIAQQQKLELLRSRFEIAGAMPMIGDSPLMSERWLFRNVVGLNDQEILQVRRERLDDVRAKGALEAAGALAGASEDGGDGGAGPADGAEAPTGGEAGGGAEAGGPDLETAADDNRGQGDVITSTGTRIREQDSPVKLAPHMKTALHNRRRNLRRRGDGFPKINDRALSGDTAKPATPGLREAFEDLYTESIETIHGEAFDNKENHKTSVSPTFGMAELRMLHILAASKGLPAPEALHWKENCPSRVLVEHFSPKSAVVSEADNPEEFELYDDENGDTEPTT